MLCVTYAARNRKPKLKFYNSNKSPTRCNNFSSILFDVYLQLNVFRVSPRPSSGAQLQYQPLVLPSERGDSSAVGRGRAGFFISILSTKIITVTRYTMSSFNACSPILIATQRCNLFKVRCMICSTLSRSSTSSPHKELSLPYYILDARYSTVSSASVPTSQKTFCRNLRDQSVTSWLPWQPSCNADLSLFHWIEFRSYGSILVILVTPNLIILLKLLPKIQVLIPIYEELQSRRHKSTFQYFIRRRLAYLGGVSNG
jgi:hypothetical protein